MKPADIGNDVNNARINRNAFSHYTPNTSNDTKMAEAADTIDDAGPQGSQLDRS